MFHDEKDTKLVEFDQLPTHKIESHRREVNEMISQEGTLQISGEHGVQFAGFRFDKRMTEEQKCEAVIDWGISYLQAMRQQVQQEGMPPHPQASEEVADFLKYRQSKVKEMAPSTTQTEGVQE